MKSIEELTKEQIAYNCLLVPDPCLRKVEGTDKELELLRAEVLGLHDAELAVVRAAQARAVVLGGRVACLEQLLADRAFFVSFPHADLQTRGSGRRPRTATFWRRGAAGSSEQGRLADRYGQRRKERHLRRGRAEAVLHPRTHREAEALGTDYAGEPTAEWQDEAEALPMLRTLRLSSGPALCCRCVSGWHVDHCHGCVDGEDGDIEVETVFADHLVTLRLDPAGDFRKSHACRARRVGQAGGRDLVAARALGTAVRNRRRAGRAIGRLAR